MNYRQALRTRIFRAKSANRLVKKKSGGFVTGGQCEILLNFSASKAGKSLLTRPSGVGDVAM